MAQALTIKGTIIQFIPKKYEQVPNVEDLIRYYVQSGTNLNDITALGIVLLDNKERSHTFYAPISFIINVLNKMKEPIQIRNRVELTYSQTQNGRGVIRQIKRLPVFFERNQAHAKDKDVPAFKRMGDNQEAKAQTMISFNPLLPVPSNIDNDQSATVLDKQEINDLQDNERDMKEVFRTTLKNSQFNEKADKMFQQATEQGQDIINDIFSDKYLDNMDDYNQIHRGNFIPVKDKNNVEKPHQSQRPNVNHIKL